ncbi:hypothetical protein EDB19DRAFT_244119 [Suillus lakei]|nr:hypothetical protein EDB19DRAFT_244119 [Suillus lakei]
MLHQLYDIYTSCFDVQKQIVPSLEKKASACTMALCHLYCGRVLQAYPGKFLGQESPGSNMLFDMWSWPEAEDYVLAPTAKLSHPEDSPNSQWVPSDLVGCPDSIPEWLSHILPYHFVTGRVDENVEKLAIAVISKLLSSPCSPSTQIVANCTLLACVMVGVQFDNKDIVRLDKSFAVSTYCVSCGAVSKGTLGMRWRQSRQR